MEPFRCGFAAIAGAPSAGKSTLLNRLLGEKVAIVAAKPQTTRHRILGVLTEPEAQLIFWDTPGIHQAPKLLNQEMLARTQSALAECDVILWVVDALRRGIDHRTAREMIQPWIDKKKPVIAAVSKVDRLTKAGRRDLAPLLKELDPGPPGLVLEISGKTGLGLYSLKKELCLRLPVQECLYPEDTLTGQTLRTMAAEMIREAVFRLTGQEIPSASAVTVEEFQERPLEETCLIKAAIHVEKTSQKKMVIGLGGRKLRDIGQTARLSLEKFLGRKVYLELFVRVTEDWTKNPRLLQEFGYDRSSE
ncbi:MAG: GTPase Era [Deltaproteobacteria bacterium]|jgi:GTP-binding protein Era|nr:GTPase Era [Deltaproteobacteria bacterium]